MLGSKAKSSLNNGALNSLLPIAFLFVMSSELTRSFQAATSDLPTTIEERPYSLAKEIIAQPVFPPTRHFALTDEARLFNSITNALTDARNISPNLNNFHVEALSIPAVSQDRRTLVAEYQRLTNKRFEDGLTDSEADSLLSLKRELDTVDGNDPKIQAGKRRLDETYNKLFSLESEIQELIQRRS